MPSAGVLQAAGKQQVSQSSVGPSALALPNPAGTADKAASVQSAGSSPVKEEVRGRAMQTVLCICLPAKQAPGMCTS